MIDKDTARTAAFGAGAVEGALSPGRAQSFRHPAQPVSRPWAALNPEFQKTIEINDPRSRSSSSYDHPFKLSVTDGDLYVNYGCLLVPQVYGDTANKPFVTLEEATVSVDTGALNNHPDGLDAGFLALSSSTTYGVWFELTWATPGAYDKTAGIGGEFVNWIICNFSLSASVVISDTYTASAFISSIMGANAGKSYIFIGTVDVDSEGGATIKQHLRSDLTVPALTFPSQIMSGDGTQALTLGTDGGILYDAP